MFKHTNSVFLLKHGRPIFSYKLCYPYQSYVRECHCSSANATVLPIDSSIDPFVLVANDLNDIFKEIHHHLTIELCDTRPPQHLLNMAKYYFDGQGKMIRPVLAMLLAQAFNHHFDNNKNVFQQRRVSLICEMIHTASLVHDDILDDAKTRRGHVSINRKWNASNAVHCGNYIIAISSKLIARIENHDVITALSRVLMDLVQGELQQLLYKSEENDVFQLYINKSFKKTASLIAYTCQANAILAGATPESEDARAAFEYGRHIGIAFQLIDDLLDFVSSSDLLGKPAAADLRLGLATAPVLFAVSKFPQLEAMISRRFTSVGDVEAAFEFVQKSDGIHQTRLLAKEHADKANEAVAYLKHSDFKTALQNLSISMLNRFK